MAVTNDDAVREKLIAIADAVRVQTGGTESMTLDEMAEAIGSISSDCYFKVFTSGQNLVYSNTVGNFVYTFPKPFKDTNYTIQSAYITIMHYLTAYANAPYHIFFNRNASDGRNHTLVYGSPVKSTSSITIPISSNSNSYVTYLYALMVNE